MSWTLWKPLLPVSFTVPVCIPNTTVYFGRSHTSLWGPSLRVPPASLFLPCILVAERVGCRTCRIPSLDLSSCVSMVRLSTFPSVRSFTRVARCCCSMKTFFLHCFKERDLLSRISWFSSGAVYAGHMGSSPEPSPLLPVLQILLWFPIVLQRWQSRFCFEDPCELTDTDLFD